MNREHRYSGLFVFEREKKIALLYHLGTGRTAALGLAESDDGMNFISTRKAVAFVSKTGGKRSVEEASSFRVSRIGKESILSFLTGDGILGIAKSSGGLEWKIIGAEKDFSHPTVFVALPKNDRGPGRTSSAGIAAFSGSGRKFVTLSVSDTTFRKWDDLGVVLEVRPRQFDASSITPMHAAETKDGLLLVYTAKNQHGLLVVGAALFDPKHPETVLWRSGSPLWTAPANWYGESVSMLGGAQIGKYFYGYFQRENEDVETFPMSRLWETYSPPKRKPVGKRIPSAKTKPCLPVGAPHRLIRHHENPILAPRTEHHWEALSAFNAAAVCLDDRIRLLYRAQGYDGISVLGYAESEDGMTISERLCDPVFVPMNPFDRRKKETPPFSFPYLSGGGWGGCEDPRVTRIGKTLYMTYVAFNGMHPPGVALTKISVRDFLNRKWNWSRPRLISRPGTMQKNWVVFPEKIRGKYAVLHNISPEIRIEYLDSLQGDIVIDSLPPRRGPKDAERWDSLVRGVGAPPIRTEHGWLLFYHAMDDRDPNKYKVGVMLLDLSHPETVLARSPEPVLEPETDYENHGHKHGVVYVCGAAVKDGTIFVYYGASDRTLAVATAPLDAFVAALKDAKAPKLETITLS